jgi:CBS domain-containing protein
MTTNKDTVSEIMTRDVVTVTPDETVERAVRLMVDHDIGSVVVEDDGRPVGLFTERDLTRRILDEAGLLRRRLGDVMSAPVVSAEPGQQIVGAFELMNAKHLRRLPVVEGGRLVGIVTERDLLRWVGAVAVE